MQKFQFQPYDKISESTADWDVQNIKAFKGKKGKGKSLDREYLWVVTEKVHGANICFLCDGTEVKAAKRSEILASDDDFFG